MSEEKEQVFKVGSPPIPKPPLVEENEAPQEEEETLEIPEYNTSDFEEERTALTPEEEEERKQIIRKLFRYKQAFTSHVVNLPISDSVDMTIPDLRRLLEDTEYMISCRKSSDSVKKMFVGGCAISENVITRITPLKIQGLTQHVARNEELLDIVEEISIKRGNDVALSPETRLMLCMGQLVIELHTHNKNLEKLSETPEAIEKQQERDKKIDELIDDIEK